MKSNPLQTLNCLSQASLAWKKVGKLGVAASLGQLCQGSQALPGAPHAADHSWEGFPQLCEGLFNLWSRMTTVGLPCAVAQLAFPAGKHISPVKLWPKVTF